MVSLSEPEVMFVEDSNLSEDGDKVPGAPVSFIYRDCGRSTGRALLACAFG